VCGVLAHAAQPTPAADGTVQTIALPPEHVEILPHQPVILASVSVVVPEGEQVPAQELETARRIVSWTEATSNNQPVARYRTMPEGDVLSQGMFKNPGPRTLQVVLVSVEGERTLTIAAGDGFYVGDLALRPPTHEMQCRCSSRSGQGPIHPTITVKCPPASATGNDACPCDTLNGIECETSSGSGTTADFTKILVPV